MENPPIFDIGKWAISHGYVSHNQRVNTSNDSHFPIKNGDVPIKNCDFPIKNGEVPIKNGDLCCRKFPMETGSPILPCDILRIPAATHDARLTRPVTPAPYKLSPENTMATCWAILGFSPASSRQTKNARCYPLVNSPKKLWKDPPCY